MPDNKPLTILDFQDPDEVSVVDQAANKRKFPIWKNKESNMDPKILQAVMEQALDDEKAIDEWVAKAKLSEKGAAAVKAAVRILGGFKEELPADIMTKLSSLAGMEAPAAPAAAKPNPFAKKEEAKPVAKKEEPVAKALAELPEEVRKALDKEREDRDLVIKSLKEDNEKIAKALADQADERNLDGWRDKAKTELSHYPGESSEEIAKALHKMEKVDPELAAGQFKTMKAASDALKGSEIFKNAGSNKGVAAGSAWEELEKLASGVVEKSAKPLDQAHAMARVLETKEGQALYTKYEEEQGA